MFKIKKPRDFKFTLGDEVKCQLTGFTGIVVYRAQWMHNCNTYGVQPMQLKDGAPQEKCNFDEPQLIIVKKDKVKKSKSDKKTGGPERALVKTTIL